MRVHRSKNKEAFECTGAMRVVSCILNTTTNREGGILPLRGGVSNLETVLYFHPKPPPFPAKRPFKFLMFFFFVFSAHFVNPLNAELNTICHLLALLGAHHILHVSRIMVKPQILLYLITHLCLYIHFNYVQLPPDDGQYRSKRVAVVTNCV